MNKYLIFDVTLRTSEDFTGVTIHVLEFHIRMKVLVHLRYLVIGTLMPNLIDKTIGKIG